MNNAELIKALRETDFGYVCEHCEHEDMCRNNDCVIIQAADALEAADKRIAELEAQLPKEGEWIMDEHPHDGDCRCSVCLIAIDAMHERNHKLLNALTGGKWWTFYRYCPNCGARMQTVTDCHTLNEKGEGGRNDNQRM